MPVIAHHQRGEQVARDHRVQITITVEIRQRGDIACSLTSADRRSGAEQSETIVELGAILLDPVAAIAGQPVQIAQRDRGCELLCGGEEIVGVDPKRCGLRR